MGDSSYFNDQYIFKNEWRKKRRIKTDLGTSWCRTPCLRYIAIFFWIALGIAAAGYFIGGGLKNFNNPDSISELFDDEDGGHELIMEKNVHYFIGISKEDAKVLLQEYPDIPHVLINNNVYYPKEKLKKWLMDIGEWSGYMNRRF